MIQALRKNSQFYFCPLSFVFDTYNSCDHQCKYCFSHQYHTSNRGGRRDFFNEKTLDYANIDRIKDMLADKESRNKLSNSLIPLLTNRIPIHWGSMSNPLCNYEKNRGITLEFLKLFNKVEYPYILSTKSDWVAHDEKYVKELSKNKDNVIQVSLISLDKSLEKIEPGTTIQGRLDLIERLSKTNRVIVRLQPFIPRYSDKEVEKLIKKVSELGATGLTIEFLKIGTFALKQNKKMWTELSNIIGFNIINYYKKHGETTATDMELKPHYKYKILSQVKNLCEHYNIEFYCADNMFRDMGNSPCCCGLPKNHKYYNDLLLTNFSTALYIAKEKGKVTFSDLFSDENIHNSSKIFLEGKIGGWMNLGNVVSSIARRNITFRDQLKSVWDKPKNVNSPSSLFLNLRAAGLDNEGHVYYEFLDKI